MGAHQRPSRRTRFCTQPRGCWCGDTACFLPPSPEPEPPHRAPATAVGAAGVCGWVPSCAGSLHIWRALGVTVPPPPNRRRGSFWAVSCKWQRFVSAVCVVPLHIKWAWTLRQTAAGLVSVFSRDLKIKHIVGREASAAMFSWIGGRQLWSAGFELLKP